MQGSTIPKHLFGAMACPRCDLMLKECHPFFRTVLLKMKAIDRDCHIFYGFRNKSVQDDLFNQGKTEKRWPNSKHNRLDEENNPKSEAIDIFFLESPGKAVFYEEYYKQLWENLPKYIKDQLTWGGTFRKYDGVHFEIKSVKSLNENLKSSLGGNAKEK